MPMISDPITHRNRTLAVLHVARRLLFSSLPSLSPRLLDRYGFVPPPSLRPHNRNPSSGHQAEANNDNKKKKTKVPYRPPSSLDRDGQEPVHSDLPFDFRFSYTEGSPNVKPVGLREPKYSPFGPGRLDRIWTGFSAPAVDPTVRSVDGDGPETVDLEKAKQMRTRILGKPLSPAERAFLVEKYQKNRTKRQVNLGRDGLTHNMLNDIHNNWKNAEAVRIKCLGVPTVDMENVCTQLEVYFLLILFLQLPWSKHVTYVIDSSFVILINYLCQQLSLSTYIISRPCFTFVKSYCTEEDVTMLKNGLRIPLIEVLLKNGYYASLVPMVRDAFLTDELVRIDCKGLEKSDYKKIGVKLRDLVPCVLVTFEKEQIVAWRGKTYNRSTHPSSEERSFTQVTESAICAENCSVDSYSSSVDQISDLNTNDEDAASSTS
ncbi:hypothetical protein C4D60_Mb03t20870 [Musa balbisiana]|uniref:CRM domain-containing protein n=1 Tax=Musa balbisiana TaxID=52838 RepID=A0A4S8JBE1_MUSBA|nr:hypothetical protein C4D60_Mb03t20870 [Musa balbisiana]